MTDECTCEFCTCDPEGEVALGPDFSELVEQYARELEDLYPNDVQTQSPIDVLLELRAQAGEYLLEILGGEDTTQVELNLLSTDTLVALAYYIDGLEQQVSELRGEWADVEGPEPDVFDDEFYAEQAFDFAESDDVAGTLSDTLNELSVAVEELQSDAPVVEALLARLADVEDRVDKLTVTVAGS